MKTKTINGWKYDTETSQEGVAFKDLKIPKGKELWTHEDCIALYNDTKLRKELNLEKCWFWIVPIFDKFPAARFFAFSDRANLICGRDPSISASGLGVRFKEKVEE